MSEFSKVIALGLDAAELTLIERGIGEKRLPNFARLMGDGHLTRIDSAGKAGSGAVWPTFYSETPPEVHGRYAEWSWKPDAMNVQRASGEGLRPFWADLALKGVRTLTLDIPFAPLTSADDLFEIREWGPHDLEKGVRHFHPPGLQEVLDRFPVHPYRDFPVATGPDDVRSVQEVADASMRGAGIRGDVVLTLLEEVDPDLAILVFPELHHAGHDLWHTIEPDNPLFAFPRYEPTMSIKPDLMEIYEVVDHEIGRIIDAVDRSTTVMAFALHGLRAAPGVVTLMSSLLEVRGYASPQRWAGMGWGQRRKVALRALKRRAPAWVKAAYDRRVDYLRRASLAGATIFEAPHWDTTRAFAPTKEAFGYARINLIGRESKGIVPAAEYEDLRHELELQVRALTDAEGRPLVESIHIPTGDPLTLPIPDLCVYWDQLAYLDDLHLAEKELATPKIGLTRTSQHNVSAFCLTLGPAAAAMPAEIEAPALGACMKDALGV